MGQSNLSFRRHDIMKTDTLGERFDARVSLEHNDVPLTTDRPDAAQCVDGIPWCRALAFALHGPLQGAGYSAPSRRRENRNREPEQVRKFRQRPLSG
jgi:hypothetical protein